MNPKKSNIKKFFYAELFNQDCSSSFCSYMKNLKSDDKKLYEKALKLACKIEPFKNNFDVIASVPKYDNVFPEETNYSQKTAEIISSKLNIPYEKNIISKIKYTRKLRTIPGNERFSEIDSAFKINKPLYKRICVVDDVYSSGATMAEIVKTFNKSGITEIYVAVLVVQSENKL
ncbi:MAG: hypothetical protein PHT24_03135 [Endomicrobiaceae bacterium]|jgi:predicted amidophosphoribosyltransferase|nr:hypothetical protein [Endomicrobiaceae bacterium]MDD4166768.1 hypothetical protein [Endomicrobiaceae bacterium]